MSTRVGRQKPLSASRDSFVSGHNRSVVMSAAYTSRDVTLLESRVPKLLLPSDQSSRVYTHL